MRKISKKLNQILTNQNSSDELINQEVETRKVEKDKLNKMTVKIFIFYINAKYIVKVVDLQLKVFFHGHYHKIFESY